MTKRRTKAQSFIRLRNKIAPLARQEAWPTTKLLKEAQKRVASSGSVARNGIDATPVTLIPGDGIGPEVIAAAVTVVEAAGLRIKWDRQLAGAAAFKNDGNPVPDDLIRSLKRTHIALKGPLETGVGEGYRSVNVYLRKTFNLTRTCGRPTVSKASIPRFAMSTWWSCAKIPRTSTPVSNTR